MAVLDTTVRVPTRILLTLIGAVLYACGWVPGVVTVAAAWCVAAVRVGWAEARHR